MILSVRHLRASDRMSKANSATVGRSFWPEDTPAVRFGARAPVWGRGDVGCPCATGLRKPAPPPWCHGPGRGWFGSRRFAFGLHRGHTSAKRLSLMPDGVGLSGTTRSRICGAAPLPSRGRRPAARSQPHAALTSSTWWWGRPSCDRALRRGSRSTFRQSCRRWTPGFGTRHLQDRGIHAACQLSGEGQDSMTVSSGYSAATARQ
jgi:hypothetical protein